METDRCSHKGLALIGHENSGDRGGVVVSVCSAGGASSGAPPVGMGAIDAS